MKIVGLFVVVFACAAVNKLLGFSTEAMLVGTVIGAGTYILMQIDSYS
ncbi:MAG: hypothetical protein AB2754_15895 [Candidatus Thiodiazotropha endolucinida]